MRILPLSVLLITGALATACGGGGGGGSDPQQHLPGIYVDAATGNDATGDGSYDRPYRTITRGTFDADDGDVVRVRAGTYDAAGGESFPIRPRTGVTIVGDWFRGPLGVRRLTNVVGGGFWAGDPDGELHATFVTGIENHLIGMNIHNPQTSAGGTVQPAAVLIGYPGTTVDSCAMHDSFDGVHLIEATGTFSATGTLIKGCLIEANNVGINVDFGAGSGMRVEGCLVTANEWGVECHSSGIDFGGGSSGSLGDNAFTGSSWGDVVNYAGFVYALNCFWDHAPPTLNTGPLPDDVSDVWEPGSTVFTTGAQVYQPDFSPVPGGNPPAGP